MDTLLTPTEREIFNEILTDEEKNFLQYIAENEIGMEAVRKALLIPGYTQGTLKKGVKSRPGANWVMNFAQNNNANLADMVRASVYAIDFLERGLTLISSLKKQPETKVEKTEEHI